MISIVPKNTDPLTSAGYRPVTPVPGLSATEHKPHGCRTRSSHINMTVCGHQAWVYNVTNKHYIQTFAPGIHEQR